MMHYKLLKIKWMGKSNFLDIFRIESLQIIEGFFIKINNYSVMNFCLNFAYQTRLGTI